MPFACMYCLSAVPLRASDHKPSFLLLLLQAIFAVMKATEGRARQSAHLIKEAVLKFYGDNNLFPEGIVAELDAVQVWALRIGSALKRMVPQPKDYVGHIAGWV